MPSERIQRRIDRLLDEAEISHRPEMALSRLQWPSCCLTLLQGASRGDGPPGLRHRGVSRHEDEALVGEGARRREILKA